MEIEVLRPLLLMGFHEVSGRPSHNFKSWVSGGKYQIIDISNPNQFSFYINDVESFTKSFATDCTIFASAAIESAQGITKNEKFPKSLSWAVIRAYYAAFFASHSIMRSFGFACVQLEKGHLNDILEYSKIYGLTSSLKLERGFFETAYDSSSNILSFKKLNDTHADTWYCFYKMLNQLSEALIKSKGPTKYTKSVFSFFTELSNCLSEKGKYQKGNWLSTFRNNVNYKLEYGTWFPYDKGSFNYSEIEHILNSWNADKIECGLSFYEKNEVKKFFIVVSAIVRLCKLLITDLNKMCPSRKSIHSFLPISFLNHMDE